MRGFTLIELAVVMVIVGALLGALLVPLATQLDVTRVRETQRLLDEIKEALIGFAVANGNRLPCPDTSGDGVEDGPPCADTEGNLPWATLAVGREDPWGRPFRYRADDAYTAAAGLPNPPATTSNLVVRERRPPDPPPPVTSTSAGDGVPAVVFSCGENGIPDDDNDADGVTNADAVCDNPGTPDRYYTHDVFTEGTFDDILLWVSRYTLLSRLVAAETWP